jgi:serine/threonine-protein kinase
MKYGRYEIQDEIGKGSMGVVYRAHDPHIDRIIALKVLRQDRIVSEEFVQRFLKEAKAIGRLSHPSIVTVYDVGQDQDSLYIAMEFLEGISLDKIIEEKRLNIEEIIELGVQVAEALDYAHQQGVIHRDIKPANIVLTPDSQIKITDFGIARIEDPEGTRQTQAGDILGTPSYMSPEQVQGRVVDGRSDLYSLGVILYELLTGKRPFAGNTMTATFLAITRDIPAVPSKLDPVIPRPLSDFLMKCLRKQPGERFQTGSEMIESLKAFVLEDEIRYPPKPAKKTTKHYTSLILIAVVILGSAGGLVYRFYEAQNSTIVSRESSNQDDKVSLEPPAQGDKAPIEPSAQDDKVSAGEPEKGDEQNLKGSEVRNDDEKDTSKEIVQALLKVNSVPAGARIFIDEKQQGVTPTEFQLPVGKHTIRLSLQDHHDWVAPILIEKAGVIPLRIPLLPK